MLPGPDEILECPHCGALEKRFTLISGNTFGRRLWTDGYSLAPMMPYPPPVARCHQCAGLYWLRQARVIARILGGELLPRLSKDEGPPPDPNVDYSKAPDVVGPDEAGYFEALEGGLAGDGEQELLLRRLAWWRGNDALRNLDEGPRQAARELPGREPNLRRLLELLPGEDDEGRLFRAELYRELGEFQEALMRLDEITTSELASFTRQFRVLCEKGDRQVCELELA